MAREIEEYVNNRYESKVFVNHPSDSSRILVKYWNDTHITPKFSIIMPIHNQESIIGAHIQSIFDHTIHPYELILILDSCSDSTEERVMEKVLHSPCTVLVLSSETPLFETAADNLGLYCARGEYAIEIQADMEMVEYGYNQKLIAPFTLNPAIIGLSARCTHDLLDGNGVGKLGRDVEQPFPADTPRNVYYIGETCNRGPLALDMKKVRMMGYLDEVNFFLDNSDHDLFARAYMEHQWLAGHVPIEVNVNLANGSTRKPRDALNQMIYDRKTQMKRNGYLNHYHAIRPPTRPIVQFSLDAIF